MVNIKEWIKLFPTDFRQSEILIELIQKDAYNQALKDACLSAKVEYTPPQMGDYEGTYTVDTKSILKLTKK
jgi:hypothetical protein